MTANTAAQWTEVERKLSAQLSAAERIRLEAEIELRRIELENGNAPSSATTQASVAAGSTGAQTASISAARDIASQQSRLASEAESGTQLVAAPANFNPGNNTDVLPFQPVSQVAAISPSNTELTARRIVLPSRPQTDAQTFETVIQLPTENSRPGPVEITEVAAPRIEQQELPPLSSPEQISEQFDGVPALIVPQRQQTPDISLAPSEIAVPLGSETTSLSSTQPGQAAPIDRSRDQPVPGPAPIFSSEDPDVLAQAQRNAQLGELGINTDVETLRQAGIPFDDAALAKQQARRDSQSRRVNVGASTTSGPAGQVRNARQSNSVLRNQKGVDWRFKISLHPNSTYLYNDNNQKSGTYNILRPLKETNGVIFPYTPKIDLTYSANYDAVDIVHTNYKFWNYKNSSVDNISISGDFTAQDTYEANYLLAVIHFFRSVTKMFFGKDSEPPAGVPPPLCYLNGHGTYAFNNHPCVISSFNLNYPLDVDYVNANVPLGNFSSPASYNRPIIGGPSRTQRIQNLRRTGLNTGGIAVDPVFRTSTDLSTGLTRVPSKMTISITALPVVTRNDLSNNFSLKDYASGALFTSPRLTKNQNNRFGGMW